MLPWTLSAKNGYTFWELDLKEGIEIRIFLSEIG